MPRKKVKLAWIPNNATRRSTMKKRHQGLIKKVHEINVLCDIEACAIIYAPQEQVADAWPSVEAARRLLVRFMEMPELQRNKHMIDQEGFLKQRVAKLADKLQRNEQLNRQLELQIMIYYGLKGYGMQGLSIEDCIAVSCLLESKLKEVYKRREELIAEMLARAVIQPPPRMHTPPAVDVIPMAMLLPSPPPMVMELSHVGTMLRPPLSVAEEEMLQPPMAAVATPSVDGILMEKPPPPVAIVPSLGDMDPLGEIVRLAANGSSIVTEQI
ncbi:hypothetical protein Cni_G25192 [Canna indica]|uniref:MADS-box domain-containing protein n=1 Tax=Canna indica TaxID=4628 RepID=A0AAQ3KXF0_9LILI|nr:hypothetical protein Cni_G25192 [Canna indica]